MRPYLALRYIGGGAEGTSDESTPPGDGTFVDSHGSTAIEAGRLVVEPQGDGWATFPSSLTVTSSAAEGIEIHALTPTEGSAGTDATLKLFGTALRTVVVESYRGSWVE